MSTKVYPAVSANTIVLWGRWFDHLTREGRDADIVATPRLAPNQSGTGTPNLRSTVDEVDIKTEPWRTRPLRVGALWALPLLSNDDAQFGAFGGYDLQAGDEPVVTVELPENSPTIVLDQEMIDALGTAASETGAATLDLTLGQQVQALWIGHAAVVSNPAPIPPEGFLSAVQTTSLIASYTWRPRGAWSSATAYEQRDVVRHGGQAYVAVAPSQGVTPGVGVQWELIVAKGDTGGAGATGGPGPANSLAIGTVTTGAAGSSAAAQITGSAPSQTLNLTVPRGDKGDGSVSSVDGNSGPNVTLASDGAAGTATKRSLGTGAAQAAAGNDSRITGAAQKAQNLADLPDKAASRTNLGLGSAATFAAADLRDAATHTGQRTSASISDFAEAVQDAVASLLGAGSNIVLDYNDAANTLTVSASGGSGGGLDAEAVRDAIGVALVGVAPVSVVVNDAADTITISSTATQNSTDAQLRDRSTHTGPLDADVITTGVFADERLPSSITRDVELSAVVSAMRSARPKWVAGSTLSGLFGSAPMEAEPADGWPVRRFGNEPVAASTTMVAAADWDLVRVVLYWTNLGNSSGDTVSWQYFLDGASDGDTLTNTFRGGLSATVLPRGKVAATELLSSFAVRPGAPHGFKLVRIGNDPSDTHAENVGVLGVLFQPLT